MDGQEMVMPVALPAELWRKSGRWYAIGDDLMRMKDRAGRDMCLAMTHEEVMADLVARSVNSYRHLPIVMYQIQTKFRDEPRPRGGMLRVREFTMKDAYSFHVDQADLDEYYPRMYEAYFRVFRRAGLDVVAIESDMGMMGGTMAHEFMALSDIGEDTIVQCRGCTYRANRQVANFRKDAPPAAEPLPLEEVHTPGADTIAALADMLDIETAQTAKALFLVALLSEQDQNREQLCSAWCAVTWNERDQADQCRQRRAPEARDRGRNQGRGGRARVRFAAGSGPGPGHAGGGRLVCKSPNLVAGANRPGLALPQRELRARLRGRIWSRTLSTPTTGMPVRFAAASCTCSGGWKSATRSSWAPSTASRSVPTTRMKRATSIRS